MKGRKRVVPLTEENLSVLDKKWKEQKEKNTKKDLEEEDNWSNMPSANSD